MGHNRVVTPVTLLDQADVTSAQHSKPLNVGSLSLAAFFCSWTNTAKGTLSVEGSIDGTNWADMQVSISQPSGSDGSTVINLNGLAVTQVRVSYQPDGVAPGTGTLTVQGCAKGA